MQHHWTMRPRPARLERRIEFPDYAATREFLAGAESACERAGIYPDISFGRTYANLTLHGDAAPGVEGAPLAETLHRLAAELDALVPGAVAGTRPRSMLPAVAPAPAADPPPSPAAGRAIADTLA